jgi:signal transduction histidine kinase
VAPSRRKLYSYAAVVVVYVLVFGWWMFFFAHQDEFLVRRLAASGVVLAPGEEAALREATGSSMRMFIFEGGFLGLLLVASVALVFRSLRKELSLHRQQKNFLSAVTHELKSPIASARLYLESLQLGRAEGEKRERYLRHAHDDLVRLQGMVESLLQSARMSTTGPQVRLERLDLADQTRRILDELSRDSACAAAEVELDAGPSVSVEADPAALRTILGNLISNAVKYAGPRPRVKVELERRGERVAMIVRDYGPGLRGVAAKRVFEPFVRGGDENVRTRPGVGLGLYMVAELARAQRGGSARSTAPTAAA